MPPNKPQTALSLETFREVINWHPFLFYQLANEKTPLTDSADLVVAEYTWQRPMAASRSDFRRAIAVAEQKLATFLSYDVATRYRQEALDPGYLRAISGPPQTRYGGYGANGYAGYYYGGGGPALVQLQVGKIQKVATVGYTALTEFAVTITDEDGDGLLDTFTGTFADSATADLASVLVAFQEGDQPANSFSANSSNPVDWQIRPVTVTRPDASTIEVTGPSWLLVKPVNYERAGLAAGYNSNQTGISSSGTFDPNAAGTYVSGLAAWVKGYSSVNQATFVRRYGAEEYTSQVDVTVVNADLGQLQVNLWGCYNNFNTLAPSCWPGPGPMTEELRINYEAGATGANYQQSGYLAYQTEWEQVVARFAIAELAQVPGATQKQNPALYYWREDLAHTGSINNGSGDSYRISNEILGNPFRNTRRGAVEAFLAVSSLAQHRAVNF